MTNTVPNNRKQICLHQLENQIQILLVIGTQHLMQFYYIRMRYFLQNLDLSVRTLCINIVPKCPENLFKGVGTFGDLVLHFPDMPVGPTSHQLVYLVFLCDMLVYSFRHLNYPNLYIIKAKNQTLSLQPYSFAYQQG